jgi:kynurenine 3-monooxygenase
MTGLKNMTITIIGAGLAGSLMACMLARRGCCVQVVERRPDPRARGFIGGRSINLALSTRGIHALEQVGLAERVLAEAIPMRGRMMHAVDGATTFQPYSKNPQDAINSVSRGGLNLALLDAADAHGNVTLRFGCRCLDVDLDRAEGRLLDEESGQELTIGGDVVIGADGAFSVVRGQMQRTERFDYGQQYLDYGYRELTVPPTADGRFAMEPNALHIWPRGGYMMIALPNRDCSFTCTLFWPYEGPASVQAVRESGQVEPFFQRHFPDAVPLMPTLVEDYRANPIGSLVTVRCHPWHRGRAVLLGDAAHAVVPFYGQGMNAAFEGCVELDACFEEHGADLQAVFARYTAQRKPNADAIADLALANFVEMRDRVGSSAFLMKKKLEQALHRLFPRAFLPLYNMVSFSRIPYDQARRWARRRNRVVRGTLAAAGVVVVALAAWLLLR